MALMKTTVLCAGLSAPHAGWVAIDELAFILARCFDAELLSSPELAAPWLRRMAGRTKPRFAPIASAGGDVLIVVARGPGDLAMAAAIQDVRRKFTRIHAFVTDSYFQAGFVDETALYDSITVTAHEDMAYPAERFGIKVHQLYQGSDCLQWAPRQHFAREIDIMAFGRTPPSYQACFSHRFHASDSPFLYLHSPLGNLGGASVHLERGMLFKLLHRTRISLAYHLLVEPQGNRPKSMMVTSRWLESLLSGCIVAGRRPVSRMADEMLNWDGATVELPDAPEDAADRLSDLLKNNAALDRQRQLNIERTLAQHDWRYRIARMCALFDLPQPAALQRELAQLQALARSWQP
jgi:hypothetical protein